MKSISSLINARNDSSSFVKGVNAALIIEKANEVLVELLGNKITKFISILYYKNGILAIQCQGSTISQELKLREGEILDNLNNYFITKNIKRLKFVPFENT